MRNQPPIEAFWSFGVKKDTYVGEPNVASMAAREGARLFALDLGGVYHRPPVHGYLLEHDAVCRALGRKPYSSGGRLLRSSCALSRLETILTTDDGTSTARAPGDGLVKFATLVPAILYDLDNSIVP